MTDQDELLEILQAHGQQFLGSFSPPVPVSSISSKKRKRTVDAKPESRKITKVEPEEEEYEEWGGIIEETSGSEQEGEDNSDGEESGFEQEDDESRAESSSHAPSVIVFSDGRAKTELMDPVSKAKMKAFMSSKVSKLRQEVAGTSEPTKSEVDEDDERSNAQNDALLHRLVHTKLLTGSMDTELELTPAQRRKALAGRVLELAGGAKIGKGEKLVREAERNKASKRVRDGMIDKQAEREKQKIEEAKNLGNYHPALKKLFESSSSGPDNKKRERGLTMGVGTFTRGSLKLSREEVNLAQGGRQRFGRGGNSRGGSRGGSRGRRGGKRK